MNRYHWMLIIFFIVLIWSAINPYDYFTWFAEVIPGIIILLIFGLTYKKHRFTDFTYYILFAHCLLLFVGGHYTYAKVPLFTTLGELLDTGRNSYDKIGHLFQGFTPVLVVREFLIRKRILKDGIWNSIFAISVALAFSAFYEIIEWFAAISTSTGAEDFLGTQGYEWDTQADMFWALIGGLAMLLIFRKYHNRLINRVDVP
ncbi:MAG: DUF2238 domain-containing protein [Bacteroidales bacterium]|nr:DUF2238 domain-containing protein [Bacteroidales bacterium]MDD3272545.1 DUF2238 domain-containing protein [Bacteroidales bacterium]MDD4057740.1 DUF2238 domain-containing protein [Bacteroidales bacterium]